MNVKLGLEVGFPNLLKQGDTLEMDPIKYAAERSVLQ